MVVQAGLNYVSVNIGLLIQFGSVPLFTVRAGNIKLGDVDFQAERSKFLDGITDEFSSDVAINRDMHLEADSINRNPFVLHALDHVIDCIPFALIPVNNSKIVVEQLSFRVSRTSKLESVLNVSWESRKPRGNWLKSPLATITVPAYGFVNHIPSEDIGVVSLLPDSLHYCSNVVFQQLLKLNSIEAPVNEPGRIVVSPAEIMASKILAISDCQV